MEGTGSSLDLLTSMLGVQGQMQTRVGGAGGRGSAPTPRRKRPLGERVSEDKTKRLKRSSEEPHREQQLLEGDQVSQMKG